MTTKSFFILYVLTVDNNDYNSMFKRRNYIKGLQP